MDQTTFLSSPGFTIGAVDITTTSDHGGSLPTKVTRLAVGVHAIGFDKNGKQMEGPISRIRYFGDAILYYMELEPGRDVRVHEVKPVENSQGPSRTGELPKSAFQRMEPQYGPIGEGIMDWETFNNAEN